jgi:FXSXX-COOH protein
VDGDAPPENPQPEWQSALLDVSKMSLTDLLDPAADTALAHSLRRLAENQNNPAEPIAGFNSAL